MVREGEMEELEEEIETKKKTTRWRREQEVRKE